MPPVEDPGRTLRLPSYDLAYDVFLRDVVGGFMSASDIIGKIATVRDPHSGPVRNVRTEQPLDQPMFSISTPMSLEKEALRSTNIDAHTEMISAFANELIIAHTTRFFESVSEICVAAGTSIENVGNGSTIEQVRQLFRKMDFSFDEEGKLSGQQLVVSPSQEQRARELILEIENDPECRRIILEKRNEWIRLRAERSHRTLSR
jgi:hypothetical protein